MTQIVNPITEDKSVGFDERGQLLHEKQEGYYISTHHISDVRGKTCALCGRGWELNGPAFSDQRYVQTQEKWVHETCLMRNRAWDEFYSVQGAFSAARMPHYGLKEIPNQYWRNDRLYSMIPWYSIAPKEKAGLGIMFVVGHRKNVWSIEVMAESGLAVIPERLSKAFENEDVTKEFGPAKGLIHAWGDQKMKDYIKVMVDVLGLARP